MGLAGCGCGSGDGSQYRPHFLPPARASRMRSTRKASPCRPRGFITAMRSWDPVRRARWLRESRCHRPVARAHLVVRDTTRLLATSRTRRQRRPRLSLSLASHDRATRAVDPETGGSVRRRAKSHSDSAAVEAAADELERCPVALPAPKSVRERLRVRAGRGGGERRRDQGRKGGCGEGSARGAARPLHALALGEGGASLDASIEGCRR